MCNVVILVLIVDYDLSLFVGQSGFRFDDTFVKLCMDNIRLLVDLPHAREGKAFDVATQRAEVGAQQFGHHVDSFVNKIDGRCSWRSLIVQGATGTYEVTHVSNVYANFNVTVGQEAAVQRVVNIRTARRINWANRQFS